MNGGVGAKRSQARIFPLRLTLQLRKAEKPAEADHSASPARQSSQPEEDRSCLGSDILAGRPGMVLSYVGTPPCKAPCREAANRDANEYVSEAVAPSAGSEIHGGASRGHDRRATTLPSKVGGRVSSCRVIQSLHIREVAGSNAAAAPRKQAQVLDLGTGAWGLVD